MADKTAFPLAWDMTTKGLSTLYTTGTSSPGVVAVGTRYLAVVTPSAVLRVNLEDSSADTIPTFHLVIAELAMTPDGSDIIASAVDTTSRPTPTPGTTDLYRLNP